MYNYNGDYILIDRLLEYQGDWWQWENTGKITIEDITDAIRRNIDEINEPFGDMWKYPVLEVKGREWHIGRILYYINHPEEIMNIDIDNYCDGYIIFPVPNILDGNHRFAAAVWLNRNEKFEKIHCIYGGRLDLLDYLTGKTDVMPE